MAEHKINLVDRKNLEANGIKNVVSFDEEQIILETNQGFLKIKGKDLHISMLDLEVGKLGVQGMIAGMEYKADGSELKARSKNILQRILK